MSNLYEILEVSNKASKEIIDKAYRVLAKKYHPDLQKTDEDKLKAEEMMKKINEAYDVLGDEEKRKVYDLKLEQEREEQKRREQIKKLEELREIERKRQQIKDNQNYTNINIANGINNVASRINGRKIKNKPQGRYNKEKNGNSSKENIQIITDEINNAYRQAYNNYLKSRGYKVKEPWTWKKFLNLLKVLGILLVIIIIIWVFPPTHNLLIKFYEENAIFKSLVDIIVKIFEGIGNGFKNVFNGNF